ncbi:IS4 family transposase [Bordetella sp. FB-8]|uniref:IS4 family transposase n=1 Tax=Bordetella sp. FB-8 TaxID=1159870 RepID=UPI00036EBE45|nr:IS4 family transposase [Bordetella sp. FB-8]
MSWAAKEFKDIDLGDQRLNKRAVRLAERLAEKPTASIPGACGGWAETAAAYRFLAQEELAWSDILAPHWQCARERMRTEPVVLCIQDTTELDFNGQAINGLGPLSYEAQRGMYLHPTYAVTPAREPLGVLDAYMWARTPKDADGERSDIKESTRWIEGYERVAEQADALPQTRLVYVADRESDIMALMVKARELGHPADWLIRAQHNRSLPDGGKLWDEVVRSEPLGEIRFHLPSRAGQAARDVRQQLRAQSVALPDGQGGVLAATCVIAHEVGAPAGVEPVQWRLLSNRVVHGLEAAVELIDWYRARWEIEMFFHVLKNGCRVEALQLATVERLERALALFMVVAWRIARLMRLGRTCPELEAELLFERDEWRAAYILHKKKPPKTPPCLNEVIRLVAMLGGFLGRKGDGEPGVKTLWQGLQRACHKFRVQSGGVITRRSERSGQRRG